MTPLTHQVGLSHRGMNASSQSLRSPGVCLPLGATLQQILTPLPHKPHLFHPSRTKRRHLPQQQSSLALKSQEATHTVDVRSSTARYKEVHAEFALRPVDLSSCLGVAFGLHDGEGLLLLSDLRQPLLLQEGHQRVPHVHHIQHLLEDPLLLRLLLRRLIYRLNNVSMTM